MTPGQRVFVHVGAPKTGTTFVQTVLWQHRDLLREHGVLYPGASYDDHFFAAVDLQQLPFHDAPRPESAGRWDELAATVREWPGTTLLSHDVFASATAEQAARAVADLAPAEVHVVVTARDLARQLPSHWQEDVKHGSTEPLPEWYEAINRHDDGRWSWRWFWQTEDLPGVLARWGGSLPRERVHLVTVPRPGAAPDTLWRRLCAVVGLDPTWCDPATAAGANTGLGTAEVELLRRVNVSLDGELTQPDYEHVVKGVLAHDTLARRRGHRVEAPAGSADETERTARQWIAAVRDLGIDVAGDLDELLPASVPKPTAGPDEPAVADTAVWAIGQLLLRLHDERRRHNAEVSQLAAEAARRQAQLDEVHARLRRIDQHPLVRLRFRVREALSRSRA